MKSQYILFALLVLIIIFGAYAYISKEDGNILPPTNNDGSFSNKPPISVTEGDVTIARASEGNTHTYTGVVSVPTPCHTLSTNVLIAESYPEQVTLEITVGAPAPDVVCAQVIAQKEFSVTFDASPEHTFRVLLNGKPVDVSVSSLPQEEENSANTIELVQ